MSHEESDLKPDAFPDGQPVKFIAYGGRKAVELRNTQDQPCRLQPSSGRIEVGREDINSTPRGHVPLVMKACTNVNKDFFR